MPLDRNVSEIVQEAEAAYGIRVTAAERAGHGSGNWNFLLTTDHGRFVLCVIEEQSADEVKAMARTLKWLSIHGYLSTKLRETIGRGLTATISGKPALLRQYLRGEVCWHPDASQVRQVGTSLARLHQLPCPDFLPTDIYYTQDRFTQALDSRRDPAYEAWVKQSLNRLDIGSFSDLPRGLIHADAFADNVLFHGGDLVAIIDFELACNYLFVFDLAMAIVGLCLHDGQPCPKKTGSLIAGYEAIRQLDSRESTAIKPLTEYAAIMTSLWRYWRYRCHEPGHAKQDSYKELSAVAQRIKASRFIGRSDLLSEHDARRFVV